MRTPILLASLVAVGAALAACTSDEDEGTSPTGTGAPSGTAAGTGVGGGAGAGGATGGGPSGGSGGAGGEGGEGGASLHPDCDSASGVCTNARWELCPLGLEPVDPDPNRDCPGSPGAQGWCCVDAPPSTCSDESPGNCVVGDSCEDCWMDLPGYDCEDGRVCCQDGCW